jgi:hypothetical protein
MLSLRRFLFATESLDFIVKFSKFQTQRQSVHHVEDFIASLIGFACFISPERERIMRTHFVFERRNSEVVILVIRDLSDVDIVILEVTSTTRCNPESCRVNYLLKFEIATGTDGEVRGICAVPRKKFEAIEQILEGKWVFEWGGEFLNLFAEPMRQRVETRRAIFHERTRPLTWIDEDPEAEDDDWFPEDPED